MTGTEIVHVPGLGGTWQPDMSNPTGGRPSARRALQIEQRRREVAVMYLSGLTQTEIAARLNVSRPTVAADLGHVKADWAAANAEDYEATIAEERATLALMQRGLAARAFLGEHDAVNDLLKVMIRKAQMLGLDKPAKVEVLVEDAETKRRRATEILGHVDELAVRRQTASV